MSANMPEQFDEAIQDKKIIEELRAACSNKQTVIESLLKENNKLREENKQLIDSVKRFVSVVKEVNKSFTQKLLSIFHQEYKTDKVEADIERFNSRYNRGR